ncbi:hypothetical protein TSMEX_007510 [Taenia solium]|eukprot:TsM_000747300 transcript=TsM_000747300 gene=TsM_000747300
MITRISVLTKLFLNTKYTEELAAVETRQSLEVVLGRSKYELIAFYGLCETLTGLHDYKISTSTVCLASTRVDKTELLVQVGSSRDSFRTRVSAILPVPTHRADESSRVHPVNIRLSVSPSSPLKTSDGVDIRDGLERVHLASSDNGSGASGVGTTTGARGGASLVYRAPVLGGGGSGSDTVDQFVGSESSTSSDSTAALLKLHNRLGRILQEACDLHKQIGHLLATVANQSV